MKKFTGYQGLLFIGDPHLWSKKPGKRLDIDFGLNILNKLSESFNIAKNNKLYPVILGDLFHDDKEKDIKLLTSLIKILKTLDDPPVTIVGNHEKKELSLTDDVALSLLKESGLIYTMEKNEIWAEFDFNGKIYCLGGTPYGQTIPSKVKTKHDTIWLTHHDLAFGSSYPGSMPLQAIDGIFMSVNGHIHNYKDPVKIGPTKLHNPGNITRMSSDCAKQEPKVWQWKPEQNDDLIGISLPHIKNIFSLDIVKAEKPVEIDKIEEEKLSEFVLLLKEEIKKEEALNKTDDGVYLKNTIDALCLAINVPEDIKKEIMTITDEVIGEEKN